MYTRLITGVAASVISRVSSCTLRSAPAIFWTIFCAISSANIVRFSAINRKNSVFFLLYKIALLVVSEVAALQ
jgi:hypothetical protein